MPRLVVPDNPRAVILAPDRYEPGLNRTMAAMAEHYGVAVLPARSRNRSRKPRDKAKVEAAVLVAQRWIIARLRNRRFFSIEEIRGGSVRLNTFPGVFEWLRRPFQAAAGIGVGRLVYA